MATRAQGNEFERLLSCLVEGNQLWAKAASVLALGVAALNFERNDKPNKAAIHDLGLATGNLVLETTARGLSVHQMIGMLPERARGLYEMADGSEAVTGIAIGYAGDPDALPDHLKERDLSPRERRPLSSFVFGGSWGSPFEAGIARTD